MSRSALGFARDRVRIILDTLETLAAGDTSTNVPISPLHDELDAIAFGINVLADELRWAHTRMMQSERVKADALRDELAHLGRLAMLDVLAGSLAHEISQPLTAIMANTEAALRLLAAQPPRLSELHETLSEILSDDRRASEVIVRMRALLKKDASRYEPLDMNAIVSEVVKLVRSNGTSRGIKLDVEMAADLEPVLGDRIQIQQVIVNLLLNAFDAVQDSENADRRVCLRTAHRDLAAVVEVIDQGPGLSDEVLTLIFEPFYTTKQHGLGLGLSISRAIIAAHGGTLQAVRNPGTGMTFSALFPSWRWIEPDGERSSDMPQLREEQ